MATTRTLPVSGGVITKPALTDTADISVISTDMENIYQEFVAQNNKTSSVIPSKVINTPESTSHTLNIPNPARYVITATTSNINRCFSIIIITYSTGAMFILEMCKGNDVTFNTSTPGKLIINTGSNGGYSFLIQTSSWSALDGVTAG